MRITDENAIKEIKRIRSSALDEDIACYPDNERDDRSDMEFLADEVSYCVSRYNEFGCRWEDELKNARDKLRETKYGRLIPLNDRTMKPLSGYWPSDIQNCRYIINEYNRLVSGLKRLQKAGYYGRWWSV